MPGNAFSEALKADSPFSSSNPLFIYFIDALPALHVSLNKLIAGTGLLGQGDAVRSRVREPVSLGTGWGDPPVRR